MEFNKKISDSITEAGIEFNIQYIARCYGVSTDAVRLYKNKYNLYPLVHFTYDKEEDILNELNRMDRFLKIKKIKKCIVN